MSRFRIPCALLLLLAGCQPSVEGASDLVRGKFVGSTNLCTESVEDAHARCLREELPCEVNSREVFRHCDAWSNSTFAADVQSAQQLGVAVADYALEALGAYLVTELSAQGVNISTRENNGGLPARFQSLAGVLSQNSKDVSAVLAPATMFAVSRTARYAHQLSPVLSADPRAVKAFTRRLLVTAQLQQKTESSQLVAMVLRIERVFSDAARLNGPREDLTDRRTIRTLEGIPVFREEEHGDIVYLNTEVSGFAGTQESDCAQKMFEAQVDDEFVELDQGMTKSFWDEDGEWVTEDYTQSVKDQSPIYVCAENDHVFVMPSAGTPRHYRHHFTIVPDPSQPDEIEWEDAPVEMAPNVFGTFFVRHVGTQPVSLVEGGNVTEIRLSEIKNHDMTDWEDLEKPFQLSDEGHYSLGVHARTEGDFSALVFGAQQDRRDALFQILWPDTGYVNVPENW